MTYHCNYKQAISLIQAGDSPKAIPLIQADKSHLKLFLRKSLTSRVA